MSGTRIEDFRADVQEFINKNHMDKNEDGFINNDNGELANLLSSTNVQDENDLYSSGKLRSKYTNGMIGTLVLGFGGFKIGQKLSSPKTYQKAVAQYDKQLTEIRQIIKDYDKIDKPAEEVAETLRKLHKKPFLMRAHNKLQLATQLVGEAALVITAALGIKAAYTTQSDKKIAMAE